MKNNVIKKGLIQILILFFILSSYTSVLGESVLDNNSSSIDTINLEFEFSSPMIVEDGKYVYVYLNESDLNMITPNTFVLPVNLTVMEFPLGTEIISINYENSTAEIINLTMPLASGVLSVPDNMRNYESQNKDLSKNLDMEIYPNNWVSYHTGGGLSNDNHTAFLVLRVYPVLQLTYNQLQFIREITVTITVKVPNKPIFEKQHIYDLLILSPRKFKRALQPLVTHKDKHGIKTMLVTLDEVYDHMYWHGRDNAEKIKYFIKDSIENWGIKYVLLVGGIKGQSSSWFIPVRHSHVIPWDDQEYAEPSFISDLYYADIYDSGGNFSSWDSNHNNIFSEWNESYKEKMDLYPDVYLGRLACRSSMEIKTTVRKIINYEKNKCDDSWFKNMVLVGGDSYNDSLHYIEGELATQEAWKHMPGFTPIKIWTSEQDINRKTVKAAIDPGCGFAYFCGHGSPRTWSTHYPPNGTEWCTGFNVEDMIYLRNRNKLPIVIVGGCHNAQFNVNLANMARGIYSNGLSYFSRKPPFGEYWYNEWIPNCWAWWLTSKIGGGAIATIANTGLGTHGSDDMDHNGVPDYLEVLDGWLEIKFFQLYGEEHVDVLGLDHGETLTEYMHRFLGNNDKMDVKMVQQWELLGDPSLKIGGYNQKHNLINNYFFNV